VVIVFDAKVKEMGGRSREDGDGRQVGSCESRERIQQTKEG